MNKLRKLSGNAVLVLTVAMVLIVGTAMAAFAAPDTSAVTAVSDGAAGLKDTLVAIAVAVLPYAAAILAITIGWRLAKRFVRG